MKRKISLGAAIALMFLGVIIAFQLTYFIIAKVYADKLDEITGTQLKYDILADIDSITRQDFIAETDKSALTEAMINGYIKGLGDVYSSYLNREEYTAHIEKSDISSVGVGIRLAYNDDGKLDVFIIESGSPADNAGIKTGDILYSIDGINVFGDDYYVTNDMLKGTSGTEIRLCFIRGEELYYVTLVRKASSAVSVIYKKTGNVGYIKISAFDKSAPELFSQAYSSLLASGVKSFVFDVRSCFEGDTSYLCEILEELLPVGDAIVFAGAGELKTTSSIKSEKELSLPSVILINEASFSCAELFAQVMSDFDKSVLVGVNTYGKGSVQKIYQLPDMSAVILSTQRFYSVKSESFDNIGIAPDIIAELSESQKADFHKLELEKDAQLTAALEYLSKN